MGEMVRNEIFYCIPEIDYNIGYRYFLGNMDNYKKALLATLKSTKSKLPILQSMLWTKEYEGLRMISQTLNKMFRRIGANKLSEASYQLEMTILNENETTLLEELSGYLHSLMEFTKHLELLLKQMDIKNVSKNEEELSFGNYDFTKTKECIKLSANLLERKII